MWKLAMKMALDNQTIEVQKMNQITTNSLQNLQPVKASKEHRKFHIQPKSLVWPWESNRRLQESDVSHTNLHGLHMSNLDNICRFNNQYWKNTDHHHI
jgi:hypothetical protein